MLVRTVETPALAVFTYIVVDTKSRGCIVIDPVRSIGSVLRQLEADQLQVEAIVETHVHADFVSGSVELKAALGGHPRIYCSAAGGKDWLPGYADVAVQDGDRVVVGEVALQACHTPGHTPEHISWLCFDNEREATKPCMAFTGDFLFVGGIGRPDLLGKSATQALAIQLYRSVSQVALGWDDFMSIYPAHGAGSLCGKQMSACACSTMGYERLYNPALQPEKEEVWVEKVVEDMPVAPVSFAHIKYINQRGPRLLAEVPYVAREREYTELVGEGAEALLVDVRARADFATGHLPGAVHVPWGASFCHWAGMMLPPAMPLWLLLDESQSLRDIIDHLRLVGLENITGYSYVDTNCQQHISLVGITAEELVERPDVAIIDVRTPVEWREGHITTAQHRELAAITRTAEELPRGTPYAVICGSGVRSAIAASWLQRAGFSPVYNVLGGMHAWRKAGLPLK